MQQLGTYSLVRRLAAGGMAEVWIARRSAMGGASKTVAIKLLAAHLAENPVYRRMFVDEARLSMMLTHSNLVQVFDVGEHAGRSYLVMEWVDGLDLARLGSALRDAGEVLPIHVIAHVIGEVLRGLAYVHELGATNTTIVHRDISPHNVLVSVSGEVKISDFGVARLASEETSGLHVRGKLRYMPPEQVRGDSKEATIDLFAVGALLQELLDGVRFRAGLERDALFGMVLTGEVPPLRRADVPAELLELRDRLLAPDRHLRIQSAREALALLRRWPGYRNTSDELAELARRFVGVAAPRSGLEVECSDEELEVRDEPTVVEGHTRPSTSDLATRTLQATDEKGSDTTPALGTKSLPIRRAPRFLRWGAVAACAVIGMLLGLGGVHVDEDGRDLADSLLAELVAQDGEIEPLVLDEGEQSVDTEAPMAGPSSQSPASDLASQPPASEPSAPALVVAAPPPQGERPRRPTDVRAADETGESVADPAKVEFAAHQFFFAWVKVGSRVLALEPVGKLDLRPGSHTVYLRERDDQPWVKAGKIRVEAGQRYRVKLERSGRPSSGEIAAKLVVQKL